MSEKVIMVVDDDNQIVDALGIILRSAGYKTLQETDPEDIIAKIEHQQPDLLVLDIRLINASGLDIAQQLKANSSTKHIPIILISARVGNLADDELGGADSYLPKPFRMKELLDKVRELLPAGN